MDELGVTVSLYNGEYVIEPCIKALKRVFSNFEVHDVGSEDDGPRIARSLGCEVIEHGRLGGLEYTALKEAVTTKTKFAFWVDADEVWPYHCLTTVKDCLTTHDIVHGYWRNLKVEEDGTILASDYTSKGGIAWNTEKFRIHRRWPREKLDARNPETKRSDVEAFPPKSQCFCWHSVLLNLSPLAEKKNRWKKRAEREDDFAKLVWTPMEELPFIYPNPKILEPARFDWYK